MFLPIKKILPGWQKVLASEFSAEYFLKLDTFLKEEYATQEIRPSREHILQPFLDVDYQDVKVLILGQDPYHGAGQAIGRAFAVPNELHPKPPSLKNIFKELKSDLGLSNINTSSELSNWTEQGVMLLNTVLTVRLGQAFSHRKHGWENFTDHVLKKLNEHTTPICFVLWGGAAQTKKALITNPIHSILESAHPSPLSASRGFLGSRPFTKINQGLRTPIEWNSSAEPSA